MSPSLMPAAVLGGGTFCLRPKYFNARKQRTGHLWQNRFFSCPVAAEREEVLLRYVEWNPVRAEMTHRPEDYAWLSARTHLLGPRK